MTAAVKINIEKLLSKHNMTPVELEKKAGLKPSAVSNILYNRSKNPSIDTLKAIAKALNCNFGALIEDSNEQNLGIDPKLALSSLNILVEEINKSQIISYGEVGADDFFKWVLEVYRYSKKNDLQEADSRYAKWVLGKVSQI